MYNGAYFYALCVGYVCGDLLITSYIMYCNVDGKMVRAQTRHGIVPKEFQLHLGYIGSI